MLNHRIYVCCWLFLAGCFCAYGGQCKAQTTVNVRKADLEKEPSQASWISLFNAVDLSDWTVGSPNWSVSEGVIRNSRGRDADWIESKTDLPSGEFTAEIRVKVVDGSRFRMHFTSDFWLGNEGYIRQFGLYGSDLADITGIGDQTYVSGKWYTLRVVVDADDLVSFYKNDILSYTAHLKVHRPSRLKIHAGDGFSEGHVEISAVRLASKALRPPPALHATTVLLDNFADGPLAGMWQTKTNGASIAKKNKELAFLPPRTQDGFAVMSTREGTLPKGSSWKVETVFRFPHRGPYGVGLGICESKNLQNRPLWIQCDSNSKQAYIQMGDRELAVSKPDAWHSLLIINDKGHWTISLDGKSALTGDFPQTDYTLSFGSDASGFKSWDWTTLSLQSVRIEYTDGPRPEWLTSQ